MEFWLNETDQISHFLAFSWELILVMVCWYSSFCHDCSMVTLPISLAFGSYLRGPSIHIYPYPFWMKVLSVSHYGVGSTRLCRTPALHASLSSRSTPARPHLMTSVFTHSNHVFRDLPFFLVPGIWKFVIDFIQDVARRKWPYHQSRRQQRTNLMSSMPSFSSSATTIQIPRSICSFLCVDFSSLSSTM